MSTKGYTSFNKKKMGCGEALGFGKNILGTTALCQEKVFEIFFPLY